MMTTQWYKDRIAALEAEVAALKACDTDAGAAHAAELAAEKRLIVVVAEVVKLKQELHKARARITHLEEELREARERCDGDPAEVEHLKAELHKARTKIEHLERESREDRKRFEHLKHELHVARERIKELEANC
jgi:chromosome segregation ATPase